jgi:hypothetical protein
MSMEALIGPELNNGLGSLAAHRKAHALCYDDLSRVLANLDQGAPASKKPRRDRKSGGEQVDPWVQLATLRAENDNLIERVSDELDRFAARVAKLEAQIRRPWWRRMFAQAEPNGRPRNRASEKLRALYVGLARTEKQPT